MFLGITVLTLVQLAPLTLQQDQGASAIDYQYYEYYYEDEQPPPALPVATSPKVTSDKVAPESVSEFELGELLEAWGYIYEKRLRKKRLIAKLL